MFAIVDNLLNELGLSENEVAVVPKGTRPQILFKDLFRALIEHDSVSNAAPYLGIEASSLQHYITRHLKSKLPEKVSSAKWGLTLLKYIGLNKCSVCKDILSLEYFIKSIDHNICITCRNVSSTNWNTKNKGQVASYYKEYYEANRAQVLLKNNNWAKRNPEKRNADSAKRRASIRRSLTNSSYGENQQEQIIAFYINRPEGDHVDHQIPLHHPLVCGLHVLANLQYLPASENLAKSNKFEII